MKVRKQKSLPRDLPDPLPLDRRDKLMAFLLAAVVLAVGYWWMVGGVCGIYHDDAIYVSTAKALASGQGYRLINLPGAPFQTKYPILYPAILALIWKLWPSFPNNLWAMQVLSLLTAGGMAGLSYLYLVRFCYCTRSVALAAGLLCATSINFVYFSTLVLSEMPFALLLLGALWALEEGVRSPQSSRIRQFFLGVLLGLPFLCRSIGITLAPVGLLVLYRQRRPLRWVAAGAAAAMLPWILWGQIAKIYFPGDHITGYYTNYLGWWFENGPAFLGRILFHNLSELMICSSLTGMPGSERALSWLVGLAVLYIYYVLGVLAWVIIGDGARKYQVLPLYLLSCAAIIILWPWPPFRFVVPILPFLLAYLIYGLTVLKKKLRFLPPARNAFAVSIGLLLIANLTLLCVRGQANHETRYPVIIRQNPPVAWSSYESVFHWLNSHTAPDDLIASGLDTMMYLYTGRRGFRPFVGSSAQMFYGDASQCLGTPEDLLKVMKVQQARYLVVTPMPTFGEEKPFAALLKKFRQRYPLKLEPVYVGADPRFVIYSFRPD